jgi:hypothetical protein
VAFARDPHVTYVADTLAILAATVAAAADLATVAFLVAARDTRVQGIAFALSRG